MEQAQPTSPATPPQPRASAAPTVGGDQAAPHRIERFPGYGARPFADRPEHELVFFGRRDETEHIVHAVMAGRLTVVYGMSGVGKTSLLKAGVFPRLLQDGFLPILVRVGPAESPSALVIPAVKAVCEAAELELGAGDETGLWEFFKTSVVWRDASVLTPVLVLDQFEEFFRTDPELGLDPGFRAHFAAELGALASGVPPERLCVDRSSNARRLGAPPDIRVVLSLREEDYGALQGLSAVIPGLFKERIRVESLTREQAREAILGPAGLEAPPPGMAGQFASPPFGLEDEAVAALLDFLLGSSGDIEGWEIQQVCHELERHMEGRPPGKGGGPVRLNRREVLQDAAPSVALDRFYLGALEGLRARDRRRARLLCEEGLLTRSGFRVMLPESQIAEEFGVSRETLGKLDALHIVRHAWRVGGKHYELTHDRLAEAVARNRRWRLPRRYRTAAWVAGVGLVLVLGLGIYGLWSYQRSSEWSRTANLLAGSLLDERFQELLDETGGIELREQIQKRIDDYTAGIDPDEESIQRIRGVAERSAGRLATSLGSSEGARVHLASSIAFYEALRSKEPAESRWHLELALSRHEFGAALVAQGYLAEGLREHELALERATAASAGAQDGASRRRALMEMARAHVALGDDLLLQHAFTEALDRFDQALELMRTPGLEGPQGSHGTLMILARSHVGRGDALSELNQVKPAREAYRKALEASQQLRDLDPLKRDVNMLRATAMNRAANAGLEGNDPRKVLEQHQRVLKLADRVLASDPRNVMTQREQAMAGKIVADALARLEQRAKADEMYASALHDMRELVRKDPRNALWRVDLAAMLAASAALPSRERAQARKQLEEAEHLLAEVGAIDGTNAAVLLARVSVLLQLNGFAELPAEARLEYARTAARIATDVRARAPESVSALWLALNALRAEAERIREGSDDPSASEEVDTLRRELLARAVASNPDDPIVLSVRADDLTALGQKAEKPEDARQAFAEAVKLNERVVDAMPDNPGALASLNRAYLDLAGALNKLGKHHEAELVSRTAVRRATAAAKASPGWGALELEKQRAHLWRSEALRERGDQASAAKELKAAEAAARAAVATSPQSAVYRTQLVSLLRGVANERSTAGDHRGAAEAFGRMAAEALQAVPLDPEGTSFLELAWSGHIWQGDALRAAGDLPAAERAYASAVEAATQAATRTPKVPERFDELRAAHSARAGVLAQLERWADSKKAYEAGRRAGESAMGLSGDPIYRTQLASLLVDLAGVQDRSGDPDGALEAYRDAMDAAGAVVAKQPDDAAALRLLYGGHRKLGELLARRGNVREAQVAYGKGLEYARRAAAADPLAAADLGELERLANRARSAE